MITLKHITKFINRGLTHRITYWQVGSVWYWEATGNGGTSDTKVGALEKARRWIKYGQ